MSQFLELVASELNELETRDLDQLFECIRDNLREMGVKTTDASDDELYAEIERQVEAEKRADEDAAKTKQELFMITKLKHTPGPWMIDRTEHGDPLIQSTVDNDPLEIVVFDNGREYTKERQEADAALISAAPELLAALQDMHKVYMTLLKKTGSIDDSIAFSARQAIAKATGGAK